MFHQVIQKHLFVFPHHHLKLYHERTPAEEMLCMGQRAPSNEFQRPESETKITISFPLMHQNKIPNWGQIKRLTPKSEEILQSEGKVVTSNNLAVALFAVIINTVSIPLATAESKNHTYWAYIPNPLLIKPFDWGDSMIPIYVNDSSWIPGPEDIHLPLFKQEEGTPFNVTYGYVSWPICAGPATECLKFIYASMAVH